MKRFISTVLAATALVVSGAAQAETYTPSGVYTWSGVVLVQKTPSPAFPCVATVSAFVPNADPDAHGGFDHGHNMTNLTIDFSQYGPTPAGLCESIAVRDGQNGSPDLSDLYSWDFPTFKINDVYVHTPTPGDCLGDISATYDSLGNLVVNSSLPGGGGTDACTFVGTLAKTSGGSVTNP